MLWNRCACTPASGREKGQIENQVQHIRQWLFTPKLDFEDLDALNAWLSLRCNELGSRSHPEGLKALRLHGMAGPAGQPHTTEPDHGASGQGYASLLNHRDRQ